MRAHNCREIRDAVIPWLAMPIGLAYSLLGTGANATATATNATSAAATTATATPTTPTPATTTTAMMMMMRLIWAYHVHGRLPDAPQVYTSLEDCDV